MEYFTSALEIIFLVYQRKSIIAKYCPNIVGKYSKNILMTVGNFFVLQTVCETFFY